MTDHPNASDTLTQTLGLCEANYMNETTSLRWLLYIAGERAINKIERELGQR